MPLPTILNKKKTQQGNATPPQASTVLSTVKTVYIYSVVHSAMCLCPLPCVLKEPGKE
jgi:hypothetical protein